MTWNAITDSFNAPQIVPAHSTKGASVADVDGNGIKDRVYYDPTNLTNTHTFELRKSVDSLSPDAVILSIKEGWDDSTNKALGRTITADYKPLTDREVYVPETDAGTDTWDLGPSPDEGWQFNVLDDGAKIFPVGDVVPSGFVVHTTTIESPKGGASPGAIDTTALKTVTYAYQGAKSQAGNIGSLGFHKIISAESNSSDGGTDMLYSVTTYRQDYPFVGQVHTSEQFLATSGADCSGGGSCQLLGQTFNGLSVLEENLLDYLPETSYQIELGVQLKEVFDLAVPGARLGKQVIVSSGDDWGNTVNRWIYDYDTATTDWVSKNSTTSTYRTPSDNHAQNYGQKLTETVTMEQAGGVNSVTRLSRYTYLATGNTRKLVGSSMSKNGSLLFFYTYDSAGNLLQTLSDYGRQKRAGYDSSGRYVDVSYMTFPTGEYPVEEVITRDAAGRVTQTRSLAGRTDTTLAGTDGLDQYQKYGALGRPYYSYNETGAWSQTYFTSGNAGCPISSVYFSTTDTAGGAQSKACFDTLGRQTRQASKGFDGRWVFTDSEYDQAGRVLRTSAPYFAGDASYWTEYGYDILGRTVSILQPHTATPTQISYTQQTAADGTSQLKVVTTNVKGQTTTQYKNLRGQLMRVEDAITGFIDYAYDAAGNLVTTNTNGIIVTLGYDKFGRKTEMIDPDKGTWYYGYNGSGEIARQRNGNNEWTYMEYDIAGRKTSRVDKRTHGGSPRDIATTTWNYDVEVGGLPAYGQLVEEIHANCDALGRNCDNVTKNLSYDNLGRLKEKSTWFLETQDTYFESFTFDQYGRPLQKFDASATQSAEQAGLEYSYNSHGYLNAVSEAGQVDGGAAPTTYFTYDSVDARGHITNATLGNGATVTRQYAADSGFLTMMGTSNVLHAVQNLTLVYDELGNLQSRRDQGWDEGLNVQKDMQEAFTYDDLNRLTSETYDGVTNSTSYDANGSITAKTAVGDYEYTAQSHRLNLIRKSGVAGPTFTYDNNGNVLTDETRTYQYTTFDKPHSIISGGNTTTFSYGADRSRYKRTVNGKTTWYVGGVEITGGDDPDSKIYTRYVDGYAIVRSKERKQPGSGALTRTLDTVRYPVKDNMGSVVTLLNEYGFQAGENGFVEQQASFDAWGKRRSASDWNAVLDQNTSSFQRLLDITPRGYTGHEMLDTLGLIHMNGRVYDPTIGRFVSADLFIQAPTNTQSYNRYAYVVNNPLRFVDPSGYTYIDDVPQGASSDDSFASCDYDNCNMGGWTPWDFWDVWGGATSESYNSSSAKNARAIDRVIDVVIARDIENARKNWPERFYDFVGPVQPDTREGGGCEESGDGCEQGETGVPEDGQSNTVNVSLGYTNTPVGIGNHALVIAADPATGEQFATRAGPAKNYRGECCLLMSEYGVYDSTFRDPPEKVHTIQSIGSLDISLAEFASRAAEFSNITNESGTPYLGVTSNSNSYAFTFARSLGFSPTPVVFAPGWWAGTPSPELSY